MTRLAVSHSRNAHHVRCCRSPNSIIATALHKVFPKQRRKVPALADSRQETAFSAWYAQDSNEKRPARNPNLREMPSVGIGPQPLSVADLGSQLAHPWHASSLVKH